MGGWRTWTGIIGLVVSGVMYAMGMTDVAATVAGLSGSIGVVAYGLGVKIEKGARLASEAMKFVADALAKQNAAQPGPDVKGPPSA